MGFAAGFMTGAGVAASGFGLPDFGLVTAAEMAERAAVLTDVLGDVPLIADADAGFGAPTNVARTVQQYERAGVAAIQLEDQAFPKCSADLRDKEILPEAAYLANLGAALDARQDALLIARTDAHTVLGLDAAIERANRYAEAGADLVVVEALGSPTDVERVAAEVKAPLLINLAQRGLISGDWFDNLQALGFAIAIHPATPILAVVETMLEHYELLGGVRPAASSSGSTHFFDLMGAQLWSGIGERWHRFADGRDANSADRISE
jgi:2-methylisocitrate lyase-like PEP mutase family enzyme